MSGNPVQATTAGVDACAVESFELLHADIDNAEPAPNVESAHPVPMSWFGGCSESGPSRDIRYIRRFRDLVFAFSVFYRSESIW